MQFVAMNILGPSTRSQCYTGRISSRPRESRACKWNELGISLRQDQRLFVNDSASTYAFQNTYHSSQGSHKDNHRRGCS